MFIWGIFLLVITIVYVFMPAKIDGQKNEYIQFFLLCASVWMVICFVTDYIFKSTMLPVDWKYTLAIPFATIAHLIYPFKKRSKILTYVSVSFCIVWALLAVIFKVLIDNSSM